MRARNEGYIWKSLVAGGVASCCAKTTIAPLDRIKILFQAKNWYYHRLGLNEALWKIYQKEGFKGYFKGNGAMMVRVFPYGAVQFMSYEQFKTALGNVFTVNKSHMNELVAGSLAGMSATGVTYPLDVVRARLAFQVAGEHGYRGIMDTIKVIYVEGGLPALYKGLVPTIIEMIPSAGLSFYTFEVEKAFFLHHCPMFINAYTDDGEGLSLNVIGNLLCGALAGAVSQTASYPLDVVRRRMQVMIKPCTRGWMQILVDVYRKDGIKRGLFRGMSINYLRAVPQIAVSFCIYEFMKQLLHFDNPS